ncbi:phage baseplate protein [Lactiplantibacillus paraxiangfangensis]|uniref:phage baseplate protein n=1 Tax=Lactiplantibacillus paraxiangfangensis TaxID=3076224 RepID=UPI0030C723C5
MSAKKKYKSAYTKAKAALTKAKKRLAKENKQLKAIQKRMAHHATTSDARKLVTLQKSIKANKKIEKSKQKKYDKAKSNLSRYKKKIELPATYRKQIMKKMHKSDYWGHRAYIMPKYPHANTSYCFVFITDESTPHETTMSSNAVEKGRSLSANAQKQATTVSITGYLGGDGNKSKMAGLKKQAKRLARWSDNSSVMTWHGDNVYPEVVITNFTPDFNHEPGTGGTNIIAVSMTLTIGDFADSNPKKKKKKTTDTGKKSVKKASSKKKGSKSAKKKRYIIAKRGYSYWYVSKKTKVSLSKIEKMNKYPARKIPIGAKIYY